MFLATQYELLDFGQGRKLERFGELWLDRPSPAAEFMERAAPQLWKKASARYERTSGETGTWIPAAPSIENQLSHAGTITHGSLTFQLKLTDFGHVGLFPEQQSNWDWLERQVRAARRPLKILNLFAYTGGSTLAAASAGASVVHVDSARNVVDWARQNAELSGLADAPIRWIVEDALRFAQREVRRGNRYDAVILDPPSYGHGPKGETWKIDSHLPELLDLCGELTEGQPAFLLATCHSPGWEPARLAQELRLRAAKHLAAKEVTFASRSLSLVTAGGHQLPCGVVAQLWRPTA